MSEKSFSVDDVQLDEDQKKEIEERVMKRGFNKPKSKRDDVEILKAESTIMVTDIDGSVKQFCTMKEASMYYGIAETILCNISRGGKSRCVNPKFRVEKTKYKYEFMNKGEVFYCNTLKEMSVITGLSQSVLHDIIDKFLKKNGLKLFRA